MRAHGVADILRAVGVQPYDYHSDNTKWLYSITIGPLRHDIDLSLYKDARRITISDTCYPIEPPEYGPGAVDIRFLGPLSETAPMVDAIRARLHVSDVWEEYLVDHGGGIWTVASRPKGA